MSGANGVERRLYRKEDSMDSIDTPPLYSGDSTMSLTSARHPLVWVFNRFRQEGKTSLCKDDLSKLVGPQVDPIQLDLAFENLDADHDGQVTIDEFIAGFSRFWCETPDTPKQEVSPLHSTRPRLLTEEHYEYGGEESVEDVGPDEQFHTTLGVLSSHNRHSMEHLWRALKEANPELLTDFEEFVSEVTSEVEGAQRALDNQRKANKKEAMELDDEIESRLSAAQTTLHIQTSLVRQEEKTKLERRLVSKESELFSVRHQLQELESEIVETQQNRQELEQQCQDLSKEKEELKEKLEISERMLHETKSKGQKIEQLEIQQKQQSYQEVELLQQKKSYEEEISKLRKELEQYSRREIATEDQEVESLMAGGVARPDLLVAHHNNQDTGSLMMEIVEKEGIASPMILKEQVLLPSPFLRTARAGSMRGRGKKASNLKSQAVLSLSLPNLADVDYLESLESPQPANRYSVLIPSPGPQLDSPSPPDNHFTPLSPPRQSLVGMGTDQHPLNWLAQDSIDPNCKVKDFLRKGLVGVV